MNAIGPGDWVECVDASRDESGFAPLSGPWLEAGALYLVAAVGKCQSRDGSVNDGVQLSGMPDRSIRRRPGLYLAERFRPIYRPKSEIIQSLLKLADEPVKEDA